MHLQPKCLFTENKSSPKNEQKRKKKKKCDVPDEDCPRNTANSAIYLTRKTLNIKNSATSNCTYKISANFRLRNTAE